MKEVEADTFKTLCQQTIHLRWNGQIPTKMQITKTASKRDKKSEWSYRKDI